MDRISLHGIDVYAHHGVHPAERELGQRFVVDVDLWVDCEAAAASDDLHRAVDYTAVHRRVCATTGAGSCHLIEAVAGRLCRALLTRVSRDEGGRDRAQAQPADPQLPGQGLRHPGAGPGLARERRGWSGVTPTRIWIGLGGNQGDRLAHLQAAVRALAAHPAFSLAALSGIWETQYVGPGRQDPYLNACAGLDTALPPAAVLAELKLLEAAEGREPDGHLRPRPLDLDLLLYGDFCGRDGGVVVPHPRARERAFVLEPLAQVAGGVRFPDSGETVTAACANIRRQAGPWVRLRAELSLAPSASDND